jgi:hypothetical protein
MIDLIIDFNFKVDKEKKTFYEQIFQSSKYMHVKTQMELVLSIRPILLILGSMYNFTPHNH